MNLLTRLENYIATMAPHQKERMGGKLLIEATAEIEKLQAWVAVLEQRPARSADIRPD